MLIFCPAPTLRISSAPASPMALLSARSSASITSARSTYASTTDWAVAPAAQGMVKHE